MMGVMLVMSTALAVSSTSFAAKQKASVLSMEMSGCTNSMTCNAELLVGDEITFDGVLTTADGEPIRGAEINIVKLIPKPEIVVIASGVTGIEGDFALSWTAEFTEIEVSGPRKDPLQIISEQIQELAERMAGLEE